MVNIFSKIWASVYSGTVFLDTVYINLNERRSVILVEIKLVSVLHTPIYMYTRNVYSLFVASNAERGGVKKSALWDATELFNEFRPTRASSARELLLEHLSLRQL